MLKNNNIFFVSDSSGNVNPEKPEGLYLKDIRYLSMYKVMWNGKAINGILEEKDNLQRVIYTYNHYLTLQIKRWIHKDSLCEEICFKNNCSQTLNGELSIQHEEDFKDIFIIRNFKYGQRGKIVKSYYGDKEFKKVYMGKDHIRRFISYSGEAEIDKTGTIVYKVQLFPEKEKKFYQSWTVSQEQEKIVVASQIERELYQPEKTKIALGKVYSESIKELLMQSLKDIEYLKSTIGQKKFIAEEFRYIRLYSVEIVSYAGYSF